MVWGDDRTDTNGEDIEELHEEGGLVCLNSGEGTSIDIATGMESVLDLTLVSYTVG